MSQKRNKARIHDPAEYQGGRAIDTIRLLERQQLGVEERRLKAKAEDVALELRLVETAALAEARGEVFDRPTMKRGEQRKPMRRLTGLEWLRRKGRITDDAWAAGERYGAVYRLTKGAGAIASILNEDRGIGGGQTIASVMQHSEKTAQASSKLAMYRRQLINQGAMIAACDTICGEELTPREASADGHEAGKLEAVLLIALDLLAEVASGGA